MHVFVGDSMVAAHEPQISVFDAGFQSGDAVWEGLRVYDGTVFRLAEHLQRLEASAAALRISLPMPPQQIEEAIARTLAANAIQHDGHIRLMLTRGTRSTSGMDPGSAPRTGTLVIVPEHKPVEDSPAPQRLRTVSIRRPPPQVLDPSIHHANQLNSILARLEVLDDHSVDAALMLDVHGYVAEADTANIFCVSHGVLRTPIPDACLHGITRDIVLGLATDTGYEVRVERLTLFDLYSADEIFITGTVCELVPVTRIDGRTIGTGEPGPHWHRLLDLYRALVRKETR